MDAPDIKRLRELEEENRRLKQIYANISLENRALKGVIVKNSEAGEDTGIGGFHSGRTWDEYQKGLWGAGDQSDGVSLPTPDTEEG